MLTIKKYGLLLLSLLVFFQAWELVKELDALECLFVGSGMGNWLLVPFFARLFIALKFSTIVLAFWYKRFRFLAFVGFVASIELYLLYTARFSSITFGEIYLDALTLWNFPLGALAQLLLFGVALKLKEGIRITIPVKLNRVLVVLLLVFALSFPFILNPVYPSDFQDQTRMEDVESPALENRDGLVACFSTTCPYCLKAFRKLIVTHQLQENFPRFNVLFLGSEEGVRQFYEVAGAAAPYAIISPEEFRELAGRRYPIFLNVENGTSIGRWDGRTFNYVQYYKLAKVQF